jgi:small conductance mechanosensitive channel
LTIDPSIEANFKGALMTLDFDTLDKTKSTLFDLAIRFGPKLLIALLITVAGFIVAGWVARGADRSLQRFDLEPPVRQLITRITRMLVLGLFMIIALQNLGVELLPLIAGLSIAGAALALATQGVLSNLVAGLTIIFTKPYRVGDFVDIVGVEGRVDTITIFNTALVHPDRSRIVIPNRKVVGEILHNYGRIRQTEVTVRVAYDTNLPQVLETIQGLVRANPRVLAEPASLIGVKALGESAVQIAVKPWVQVGDFGLVEGELNLSIVAALRQRGVAIPYPQHEVRLISGAVN